jgi:hypothetical protein
MTVGGFGRGCGSLGGLDFFDLFFVEGIRIPLLDGNGVSGTVAKAGAEPVAKVVGHKPGLAVDNLDGAFRTSRHTKSAAVAFIFIDSDDIPDHILSPVNWVHGLFSLLGLSCLYPVQPALIEIKKQIFRF